jgi:hypothetical protein
LTLLDPLVMRSEINVSKSGKPTVGFSFMTMLQHTSHFGQGFLSKEQCDNTGAPIIHSWPDSSWLLPVPSSTISTEGKALLFCCQNYSNRDDRAEKVFTEWLPGMFPTHLQSLAEAHSCTRGLFWGKYSWNSCTVLHFSEIKWFL